MEEHPPWSVEALRYSVFFVEPPSDLANLDWWGRAVGHAPSEVMLRPQEGTAHWSGPVDWFSKPAMLDLDVQPIRADWHLHAMPQPDEPLGFAFIGAFSEASATFERHLTAWFPTCPPAMRLAYGGTLLLPSPDLERAYQGLSKLLPHLAIDPRTARDFLYRVNRRRTSESLPDWEVNRISTWSVVSVSSILVTLSSSAATVASQEAQEASVRLDFDINTAPRPNSAIPEGRTFDFMQEFASLANEMAENGDVP